MDVTTRTDAAAFLKINSDNTLTFYNSYDKNVFFGEWSLLTCKTVENKFGEKVPESVIAIIINKQKTLATYRDKRLTFDYPTNLYGRRYKRLWYLKMGMKR